MVNQITVYHKILREMSGKNTKQLLTKRWELLLIVPEGKNDRSNLIIPKKSKSFRMQK